MCRAGSNLQNRYPTPPHLGTGLTAEPWCTLGTGYSDAISSPKMTLKSWPSLVTDVTMCWTPRLIAANHEFWIERPHFAEIADIISFATPQYTAPVTIFVDSHINVTKAHISNFRATTFNLLPDQVLPLVQWRENYQRDVAIIFKIESDTILSQLTYAWDAPDRGSGQICGNPVLEWSVNRLDDLKELFLALRHVIQDLSVPCLDFVKSASDNGDGHEISEEYGPISTHLIFRKWGNLALCYPELFPNGNCYDEVELLSTLFEISSSTKG